MPRIQPLISAKEAWEIKKTKKEVEELNKPLYKKTSFLIALLPFIIGISIVAVTCESGILDAKAAWNKIEASKHKDTVELFKEERQRLIFLNGYLTHANDSIINRSDSLNRIIGGYERKIGTLDSLFELAKNDKRGVDEQVKSYVIQVAVITSKISALREENLTLIRRANQLESDILTQTKAADDNCENTTSLLYREIAACKEGQRDIEHIWRNRIDDCVAQLQSVQKELDDLKKKPQ